MGSKLTPNKIDRLMKLANGSTSSRSFINNDYLGNLNERQLDSISSYHPLLSNECKSRDDISSGLLDLEHCEGFGDSCVASISTAFNPGEMTGRSTGAEDIASISRPEDNILYAKPTIDDMVDKLNKQSSDIHEIMRHSIASGYATRDLTADEKSFVARQGILPVMPDKINMNLTRNMDPRVEDSQMSVGSYFINRCTEFTTMFPQSDSPRLDYSRGPNLLQGEVSLNENSVSHVPDMSQTLNTSLDSVPVRQPRSTVPAAPVIPPLPKNPTKTFSKNPLLADPTKQHLNMNPVTEESSQEEASFSISAIETLLWNQKEVRPSNAMKQLKREIKGKSDRNHPPLREINTNIIEADNYVATLKDSKKAETASSTTSINTVIPNEKYKANLENVTSKIPELTVTQYTIDKCDSRASLKSNLSSFTRSRSNSPCSVQENLVSTSFRSRESPRPNKSKASVIEDWVDINIEPVNGFVGTTIKTSMTVTANVNTWLIARIEFDIAIKGKDIDIDLPSSPVTLSPREQNKITISFTPYIAMKQYLNFVLILKDATTGKECTQSGVVTVHFSVPKLVSITTEGNNCGVTFPPAQEKQILEKIAILLTDCPTDLSLDFTVIEGSTMFGISEVQEITRNDLQLNLSETYNFGDESRSVSRMAVRRSGKSCAESALRIGCCFAAPRLSELQIQSKQAVFKGCIGVSVCGSKSVLYRLELTASVGTAQLVVHLPSSRIHVADEPATIKLSNSGSIPGAWTVKLRDDGTQRSKGLFRVCSNIIELHPGHTGSLKIRYTGPADRFHECNLAFEDLTTKRETIIQISGGQALPKVFPIKTTLSEMCWVREGRKEISLKNCSGHKVNIKCRVTGTGFLIETSRANCTDLLLPFTPNESKCISVIFKPSSAMPHKGKLMIMQDQDSGVAKSVRLHGGAGGDGVRWRGLLTYGDTALVRAVTDTVTLALHNPHNAPAFVSATVHYHLQYRGLQSSSSLVGGRAVVRAQSSHTLLLRLPRARPEPRPAAHALSLCSVSILTGAEMCRRRVLRILKQQSNGVLDESKVPEHLKRLVGKFEGEDPRLDEALEDFQETPKSLDILVAGMRELTAQVDQPEDLGDHTVYLTDDTVLEHHTLCD